MTRVQIINKAIKYMKLVERMSAKEISRKLSQYGIDMPEDEVLKVIIDLNIRPIAPSKFCNKQIRYNNLVRVINLFKPLFFNLKLSRTKLVDLLNYLNVPCLIRKGKWTAGKLNKVCDWQYKRGVKKPYYSLEFLKTTFLESLSQEEYIFLQNWINDV